MKKTSSKFYLLLAGALLVLSIAFTTIRHYDTNNEISIEVASDRDEDIPIVF